MGPTTDAALSFRFTGIAVGVGSVVAEEILDLGGEAFGQSGVTDAVVRMQGGGVGHELHREGLGEFAVARATHEFPTWWFLGDGPSEDLGVEGGLVVTGRGGEDRG